MKRDAFVFRALVLIFILNCGLILQRQDVGTVTPGNPDVVLETPKHLNETLAYDTTNAYMPETLEELNPTLAADTKPRIAGFYHLGMMGPWKEIFHDQMRAVRGLLHHSEFLFINAVGERSEWVPLQRLGIPSDKIFLSFHGALDDYEAPTHEYLQRYCNGFPQSLVYYFHCKGVTHPDSPLKERIVRWRRLMEQFILTEWRDCVEALLAGNVACGVNLKGLDDGMSWRHFSGNFWWARCDHINRLPPPLDLGTPYFKQHSGMKSRRHYAEAWILDTGFAEWPPVRNCYESHVNHYDVEYVLPNLTALRCTANV